MLRRFLFLIPSQILSGRIKIGEASKDSFVFFEGGGEGDFAASSNHKLLKGADPSCVLHFIRKAEEGERFGGGVVLLGVLACKDVFDLVHP